MIDLLKTARSTYQQGDTIKCLYDGKDYVVKNHYELTQLVNGDSTSIWLIGTPNILLYENKKWATIISRPSDKQAQTKQYINRLLNRQSALIKELNNINKRIIKSYEEIN